MRIGKRTQAVLVEAADPPCDELHSGDVCRFVLRRGRAAAHRRLHASLLQVAGEALDLILLSGDSGGQLLWLRVHELRERSQHVALLLKSANGIKAGDRLDPSHAGSDPALGDDGKEADVACRLHMRAPAELDAE